MFTVRIEPHARDIGVRPGQNVLDAALAAGLNIPHSCKAGHCGSCRARLRSGEIRYPRGRPAGLTAAEAAQGRVLLCQAEPETDLVVDARLVARVPDVEIKRLPCRIAAKTLLAPDVLRVDLRLPAVEPLAFRAGQYLDVLLDGDRRRSFSIASPPHDAALLELHVRRVDGGGFTQRLFDELDVGALLRIEAPIGQFAYERSEAPLLLVAGGTGFAPIKSILRTELETGAVGGGTRPVHLFWGARQPVDVYEDSLLRRWADAHPRLRYTAVLSEATTTDAAHQRLGWVHEVVLREYPAIADCDAWVAGPPALIDAARAAFTAAGLPAGRLRFDSFDYAPR
ncbi:MAG: FAD-binding oxidoreductase [Steroidobacteraceae bacterium]